MSKQKIYEVEIQSMEILRQGKKSFITYFQGGHKTRIVSNARKLYPDFFKEEDKPVVHITQITYKEYLARLNGKQIEQKKQYVEAKANIIRGEDYGTLEN